MTAQSNDLLDRAVEIAAIEAELGSSAQGAGRLVVISAEIGAGKTALMDVATDHARAQGFTVLATRGSFLERNVPYGLACRLFEPVVRHLDDAELGVAFEDLRAAAARLSTPVATDDTTAPGDAAPVVPNALHRMLTLLVATSPVLVAVDDVQWIDAPSLRWLGTLPPRIEHAPVALVISHSDGEPCAEPALLEELLAARALELRPAGLHVAATAALLEHGLGRAPDPEFVAACVELTGGNPMLLHGLLDALAEKQADPTGDAVGDLAGAVPATLAPTVRVRLRRVSSHATAIAQATAVLGQNGDLDRVAEVTGIDLGTVAEVATTLTRMGVLRLDGRTLSFAYPLLRNLVGQDLTFTALQAVHAQAARLLQASGAPADCIAEHLVPIEPLGEEWVPTVLREAARTALGAGRPDTAVTYLRRALTEPLPDGPRTAVLVELGTAEAHVDVGAATRHLAETVALGGGAHKQAELAVQLADLLALSGREEEAIELIVSAGGVDDADLRLVELRSCRVATAGEAVDQVDSVREPGPLADCGEPRLLSLLASREASAGRSCNDAAMLARRALVAVPDSPDDLRPYLGAVRALTDAGSLQEAYERCTTVLAIVDRWQYRPGIGSVLSVRSSIARQLGQIGAAEHDARTGLATFAGCGAEPTAGAALECLAALVLVLIDAGEHQEATDLLHDSGLTGALPETRAGVAMLLARGRLAIAADDPTAGIADLLACGARLTEMRVHNPAVAAWRSAAALGLRAIGDYARARGYAAEEVELARRWGAPGPLGHALSAQAVVVGGPWGLATHEEAVSVLQPSQARLELARCLLAHGEALNRTGRRTLARRVLRSAVEVAQQCGSPALLQRARVELQASGARRCWDPSGGVPSLTDSERRAAVLAASGKTNKQIAAMLFIHRRTVEIHLTNSYRKLGIAGRSQLAAALRLGTTPMSAVS